MLGTNCDFPWGWTSISSSTANQCPCMSNLVKPPKIVAEASWGFVWQQPPSSSFQGVVDLSSIFCLRYQSYWFCPLEATKLFAFQDIELVVLSSCVGKKDVRINLKQEFPTEPIFTHTPLKSTSSGGNKNLASLQNSSKSQWCENKLSFWLL